MIEEVSVYLSLNGTVRDPVLHLTRIVSVVIVEWRIGSINDIQINTSDFFLVRALSDFFHFTPTTPRSISEPCSPRDENLALIVRQKVLALVILFRCVNIYNLTRL